jgi:hypothetical protein
MSDWDEFTGQLLDALRRFAQGDAEPYKSLWSRGRCDDLRRLGRLPLGTGPHRSQFWSHSPRFEGIRGEPDQAAAPGHRPR